MSGIAGIIHFDGKPVEAGQVEAMTAAMHYRGPDGINHWRKGNVALGQCMLRTTPESLEEIQPLTNEDESLVLVMDGRVDNWEELRRELLGKGAVLRTRADAELVLRAYEVWGEESLSHIDGDFSMVIWDARRMQAFCARDRMGHKPFHYHWSDKSLIFSSEVHPILTLPWVDRRINQGFLSEYLAGDWYSRDETLWEGTQRLVAAHSMRVKHQSKIISQYWKPNIFTSLKYSKEEEYFQYYRELLNDSVKRLSRSHVPVGCEVSGGLDSSAVYCVAEKLRTKNNLCAPGVTGYTLDFRTNSRADELEFARSVGEFTRTHIHEVAPTFSPLSWYRDQVRDFSDFPGFPNGVMSNGLISDVSSSGARVLLTGEGGDEWLSGEHTYYAEELARCGYKALFSCLKSDVKEAGLTLTLKWFLRHGIFILLPSRLQNALRQFYRGTNDVRSNYPYWLSSEMRTKFILRRIKELNKRSEEVCAIGQREIIVCLSNAFRAIALEDAERRASRLGIELRRPFNTQWMVDYAMATPERLRRRGYTNKYTHVNALEGLMPDNVLKRRTKAEFSVVFRNQLDQMGALLSWDIPVRSKGLLSCVGMGQLYHEYQMKPAAGWPMWVLWTAFASELFFDELRAN